MKPKMLIVFPIVLSVLLLFTATQVIAARYTIRMAHVQPLKENVFHIWTSKFKELAEKYTNGAVEVKELGGGQMGSDQVAGKKLQMGAIEAQAVAVNNLAPLYPEFDIFTLPFLLKDFAHAEKVLSSDVVKELSEGAAQKANLRMLGWTPSNFRNMTNSKHPILKPEDLKDLRMRVAKNPVMIDTYTALGGNPIGMAPTELFSALQTKVVDGQDGGAHWAYALKVYEVQKYLSVTNHQCAVAVLAMNNKFFTGLPKEVQQQLEKAAYESTIYITGWARGVNGDIVDRYKEKGMKIDYPDLKPFVEKVKPVWEKNAKRVGGMERIQKVYNMPY